MEHARLVAAVSISCCLLVPNAQAQLVAGAVPVGYTLTSYTIHLEPLVNYTEEQADFDVDCDGVNDFRLFLDRNDPSIDAANRLYLRSQTDSIRICADDMGSLCSNFNHSLNYVDGQLMSCASPFAMLNDTNVVVGDYVTFTCGGVAPESADSVYIHYDKTNNGVLMEGWILLSFNIVSTDVIDPWAEVYAAIGLCGVAGIDDPAAQAHTITIHPDPSSGGLYTWSTNITVASVQVFDRIGHLVSVHEGGRTGQLDIRGKHGLFMAKFTPANGRSQVERLLAE